MIEGIEPYPAYRAPGSGGLRRCPATGTSCPAEDRPNLKGTGYQGRGHCRRTSLRPLRGRRHDTRALQTEHPASVGPERAARATRRFARGCSVRRERRDDRGHRQVRGEPRSNRKHCAVATCSSSARHGAASARSSWASQLSPMLRRNQKAAYGAAASRSCISRPPDEPPP